MARKKQYRLLILCLLAMDMLAMGYLGYHYLNRKIPDELYVAQDTEKEFTELLEEPFVTWEEAVPVSSGGAYRISCKALGVLPLKEMKVTPVHRQMVQVCGDPVGIYMETEGVLIIDTGTVLSSQGTSQTPAENIVQPGDYIVAFNEQQVTSKRELIEDVKNCGGDTASLLVRRDGEEIPLSLVPVKDQGGEYKLGIWVRDDTQGIGTLTYVAEDGSFGALGHGISDVDTGGLLKISGGTLYQAQILGVRKGSAGSPGELSGLIHYQDDKNMGTIVDNTSNGIYGAMENPQAGELHLQEMPVGYKQEMELGQASILCNVGEGLQEYEAEITKIDLNQEDTNKSFIIQVTDPKLLEITGGIVQGMSGSPVIQNGKFVGAVTHVFVQDSTSGYGIFAETMLEQ